MRLLYTLVEDLELDDDPGPVGLDAHFLSSQSAGWNAPRDPISVILDSHGRNLLYLSLDEARVIRDGLSAAIEEADRLLSTKVD